MDKPQLPQVAGYTTEGVLGTGGMATVYLAIQESLSRPVALKVMNQLLVVDDDFRKRFLNEGRFIAQLSHQNIVTVYDIGVSDGIHYFSMTHLPGGTLTEKIRKGLPLGQALYVLKCLAGALGYAHGHGIVHRDIKPGNVLFTEDGTPVLTDFGIAKTVGSETQLTSTGMTVGSARYMSPEQAVGHEVDGRSDLYSLGVLLWQMLTGDFPYHAQGPFALAMKHANDPIPKLPSHLQRFQPLINGLLAKKPEDRLASADQLMRIIDEIPQDDSSVPPSPDTDETIILAHPPQPMRSHPSVTTTADIHTLPIAKRRFGLVAPLAAVAGLAAIAAYVGYGSLSSPPPVASPDAKHQEGISNTAAQGDGQLDIGALLRQAEDQRTAGHLTDPPGDNAFESYSRVLDLDPENTTAKQQLVQIGRINAANKVFLFAETLLRQGNIDSARQMVETGLKMNPDDERLLGLKRALDYQQ